MYVTEPGHCYLLKTLDGSGAESCLIFVKRKGPMFPGNVGSHPGTTSQEVLRALIDRAIYVNAQIPCWQTKASVYLMSIVVWLYEWRAAVRHHRSIPNMRESIYGKCCSKCGPIGCDETVAEQEKP